MHLCGAAAVAERVGKHGLRPIFLRVIIYREAHALSCLLEPEKLQLAYKKKFALSHAWRGIVALLHLYAKVILRTSIERCGSCNSSTLFRVRTPSTLSPS